MTCLLCQKTLEAQLSFADRILGRTSPTELVCQKCRDSFVTIKGLTCRGCGRPLTPEIDRGEDGTICFECQFWLNRLGYLLGHQALYEYGPELKLYMAAYKFMGDYRLNIIFREKMRRFIKRICQQQKIDLIVPIPVSQKRFNQRGFNQVQPWLPKIAQNLLIVDLANKVDQSSLDRHARLHSPQPFRLSEDCGPKIKNRRVLLVDDIYTTGRTLYHGAECFYQLGAAKVSSLSLVRSGDVDDG
ncbi:ComF family protein [Fructobacillus ficulneus]|uniref:ComF family protein n=1 Tax=Fructobacillus ficulneus TaxID=157463 RepID=UPI000780544C|nr:phosphoribosyltransferase family protein [Fructobacillus ficulneus]